MTTNGIEAIHISIQLVDSTNFHLTPETHFEARLGCLVRPVGSLFFCLPVGLLSFLRAGQKKLRPEQWQQMQETAAPSRYTKKVRPRR